MSGLAVPFARKIRILGVTIDSALSFDYHITDVVRACNFHTRALRHIRPLLNRDAANTVACSMVSSRLDYCNAVLYGVTGHNISRLQQVQNTLARVVCTAPYRSSATNLRKSLHWLPVAERITFKIAMLTFKVRSNHLPAYLDELIIDYAPPRSLRSTTQGLLIEPRTRTKIASRAFGSSSLEQPVNRRPYCYQHRPIPQKTKNPSFQCSIPLTTWQTPAPLTQCFRIIVYI